MLSTKAKLMSAFGGYAGTMSYLVCGLFQIENYTFWIQNTNTGANIGWRKISSTYRSPTKMKLQRKCANFAQSFPIGRSTCYTVLFCLKYHEKPSLFYHISPYLKKVELKNGQPILPYKAQ